VYRPPNLNAPRQCWMNRDALASRILSGAGLLRPRVVVCLLARMGLASSPHANTRTPRPSQQRNGAFRQHDATSHWQCAHAPLAHQPAWACKEVIHFAAHGWSCREIEARFNREHGECMTVGHSWVAEYVKEHAADRGAQARDASPSASLVRGRPHLGDGHDVHGQRAGSDLRHAGHHRSWLAQTAVPEAFAAQVHVDAAGPFVSDDGVLRRAGGDPHRQRVDVREHVLARSVGPLGICHRRSQTGCPWQNGRIERLFGTLKPLLRSIKPITRRRCIERSRSSPGSTTTCGFIGTSKV